MKAARILSLAATSLLLGSCSGAPLPSDLERAQQFELDEQDDEALSAWRAIRESCPRPDARPHDDCGIAAMREAQLLERLGRYPEAAAAWEALPERTTDRSRAARGLVRAAEITAEKLADPSHAAASAWACVERWPDEVAADDALALALRIALRIDGARDPRGTLARLDALAKKLLTAEIVDNLLVAAARIARTLGDFDGAVARFDEVDKRFPHSGLVDDANFQAAEILRGRGDPKGAITRLDRILHTKRRALIVGSYNAMLLDDAQLLEGQVELDDLHDVPGAIAALTKLVDNYPDSNLRDDALLEIARAHLAAHAPPTEGDSKAACVALARLVKQFPDGNRVRAARAKQSELGCP